MAILKFTDLPVGDLFVKFSLNKNKYEEGDVLWKKVGPWEIWAMPPSTGAGIPILLTKDESIRRVDLEYADDILKSLYTYIDNWQTVRSTIREENRIREEEKLSPIKKGDIVVAIKAHGDLKVGDIAVVDSISRDEDHGNVLMVNVTFTNCTGMLTQASCFRVVPNSSLAFQSLIEAKSDLLASVLGIGVVPNL